MQTHQDFKLPITKQKKQTIENKTANLHDNITSSECVRVPVIKIFFELNI